MAIYHLSMKPISRGKGKSAVAAAAYRAGMRLENEREGIVHDFTKKSGIVHTEIFVPEGMGAEWAMDRSVLWNKAEATEKRQDARVAREFELALPHEMSPEQRLELTREFSQSLADLYGVAVDMAIHEPSSKKEGTLNYHAHLLMTTRMINEKGLGEKSYLEKSNQWLTLRGYPTTQAELREIRKSWEEMSNTYLAKANLDIRIDHRSHKDRGLYLEPTTHIGVQASEIIARGGEVERTALTTQEQRINAEIILKEPEQIFKVITSEKSVFTDRDVARVAHRYVEDTQFADVFAKVMTSPSLIQLTPEQPGDKGQPRQPARFSTIELIEIEKGMMEAATKLSQSSGYHVREKNLQAAYTKTPFLSDEQKAAVRHLTRDNRASIMVGLAGSGKSTTLTTARQAWENEGYKVFGAALAGKAAEGLEKSSQIPSRTLASWEKSWENDKHLLKAGDVFVIDEAGMIGSEQLARFIHRVDQTGAKVVLVGDPEQLQPINAGAAFRAVAQEIGFTELQQVRRQHQDWQQEASKDFAQQNTSKALEAYHEKGAIRFEETRIEARSILVRDALTQADQTPDRSWIILAHLRKDVRALNEEVRTIKQARGELQNERTFITQDGKQSFAVGDRVLFLENSRDLGVKNGMLGTIEKLTKDGMSVRLDDKDKAVSVDIKTYNAISHGYATTIHKSQGTTVDYAYVLGSETMDRHLTYVSMTRHRENVTLYAAKTEFPSLDALTKRLERNQSKETTLDYAKRRGIAEQFGVHSNIEIKQEATPAIMEARKPLFPAVTYFEKSVAQTAKEQISKSTTHLSSLEEIHKTAQRIWRNPDKALKKIDALIKDEQRTTPISQIIPEQTEHFDVLRGEAKLLSRFLNEGKERKEALAALPRLYGDIKKAERSYDLELDKLQGQERQRRARMEVEVPSLSTKAADTLSMLHKSAAISSENLDRTTKLIKPEIKEELRKFQEALDKRFGKEAFAPSKDPAIAKASVSEGQHKRLEGVQADLQLITKINQHLRQQAYEAQMMLQKEQKDIKLEM